MIDYRLEDLLQNTKINPLTWQRVSRKTYRELTIDGITLLFGYYTDGSRLSISRLGKIHRIRKITPRLECVYYWPQQVGLYCMLNKLSPDSKRRYLLAYKLGLLDDMAFCGHIS